MKNIENVRNEILERAQSLFARYGFDKTTLSEITSVNGRSKSSIYYHFKNKDDIFKGVVSMEFDVMKQELEKVLVLREEDPVSCFSEYLRKRVELLENAVAYGNAVTSRLPLSKFLVELAREPFDRWERSFFDSVWEGGVNAGIFPAKVGCEAFSKTLSGLLKNIEFQYFTSEDKTSVKELCSTMAELLIYRNPNFCRASYEPVLK